MPDKLNSVDFIKSISRRSLTFTTQLPFGKSKFSETGVRIFGILSTEGESPSAMKYLATTGG